MSSIRHSLRTRPHSVLSLFSMDVTRSEVQPGADRISVCQSLVRKPMTESSFRQLLLRLAFIPILSLLGFLTILGVELREIALLRFAGAQATTILLQTDSLEKSMIDQETGIRGYLAAKNALFLQPYNEASARFDGELASLRSTASSNPALTAKIAAISASYKHFNDVNQILLKDTLSNGPDVDLLKRQKQAMDILRAQLAEVISDHSSIRESNRVRLTHILGRLPAIGIGGGALIALLLLWYGNTLFREITSAFRRQLYETELQRDYFKTTLQSIGDAVVVCDSAGKVKLMNPAAVEATGWTNEQAMGQPLETVFRIINEGTRETVESPVAKVLRVGGVVGLANHTLLVRRDETELPIDDSGAPIRNKNNEIVGVVLVFRDITERRQSEAALRQSNESRLRLAAIIDSADDAIASKDLNGIVSSWNAGAGRMFGYSADEMLGQPIRRLIPEELQYEEDEILRKIRAGERIEHYETTRKKKNGETFEVSVTISPITDESGRIIGASKIARDISDRKRVERLLVQSEKLAVTGRMAATIAHEINNPLESLVNLIFLARQDAGKDGKAYAYLVTAESELERISHIARQTLGFYRDTGSPTEVYLHQLMESVLSVYSSKLLAAGITTDKQFNDQRQVLVHKGEILQIFSNIITNAADAMRQGGVLSISTRQIVGSTGDGIQAIIRDTGQGIREEHLAQVFEPFFTTKGDLGTGIGLWVTKQLVEARGGEISIASSTENGNSGTTVAIFIPFLAPSRR
jgi:PAS domain S-box-containing protein